MLETLREYALEKLGAAGETIYGREQHFEFFHQLAIRSRLYGPDKQVWLDRLEANYDNIRAAVNWALLYRDPEATQPYMEEAIELVLALVDFFWFRGYTGEAREWMDQFLTIDMPLLCTRSCFKSLVGMRAVVVISGRPACFCSARSKWQKKLGTLRTRPGRQPAIHSVLHGGVGICPAKRRRPSYRCSLI